MTIDITYKRAIGVILLVCLLSTTNFSFVVEIQL